MIELHPLLMLSGTATVEKLGQVQDGERLKIEIRGKDIPGSTIAGKVRWTAWILIGPLGLGEASSVGELVTDDRQRLVLELRGYAQPRNGDGMEVRASGLIRSASPQFVNLNGHIAVAVATISGDRRAEISVFEL